MFIDSVEISIQGGSGGAGAVSFYRDTLTMHGGPDGGNGGHGGNIIFVGSNNMDNLVSFHYNQKFRAGDGENGSSGHKTGANGKDVVIEVPLGTKFYNEENELVADITQKGQEFIAVHGGAGGHGNAHFATATKQTPNFSQTGVKTKPYKIRLELNCIADIGLVGFPNVGKSTLLSVVSRAKPKIANYHFTTLYPNIGVANIHGQNVLFADIPGLIDGASNGVGLGTDFLKHISRTRLLLHVIDISATDGRNPVSDYRIINDELKKFGADLENKKQIIVLNKIDCATKEQIAQFRAAIKDNKPVTGLRGAVKVKNKVKDSEIFEISAITHAGIDKLLDHALTVLQSIPIPEPLEIDAVLEKQTDRNEYKIEKNNNEFVVSGAFIENLIRGVVLTDTESNNYFQRRLDQRGIIDEMKKMGLTDGDTIHILDHTFEYVE
ncbi:MAG: GTPase ObgE [Christensenellaceae bacterium]|jgi:GTP-binding protein|nr:GTPase ObgE [Christensenellaceae bacterium]